MKSKIIKTLGIASMIGLAGICMTGCDVDNKQNQDDISIKDEVVVSETTESTLNNTSIVVEDDHASKELVLDVFNTALTRSKTNFNNYIKNFSATTTFDYISRYSGVKGFNTFSSSTYISENGYLIAIGTSKHDNKTRYDITNLNSRSAFAIFDSESNEVGETSGFGYVHQIISNVRMFDTKFIDNTDIDFDNVLSAELLSNGHYRITFYNTKEENDTLYTYSKTYEFDSERIYVIEECVISENYVGSWAEPVHVDYVTTTFEYDKLDDNEMKEIINESLAKIENAGYNFIFNN